MSYNYLTQFNSPNFATPDQSLALWGVPRSIENIAIHHWGDPATNPTFEGVVAHLCDPASNVSAHYVATGDGRRVACLIDPSNISYSTMSDNPRCISIELDPRCRPEDYDVAAELVADIRSAYGASLPLVPHNQFYNTACPGNWDLGRIDELAATKVSHDPWGTVTDLNPPAPVVTPEPVPVIAPTPAPVPIAVDPVPTPVVAAVIPSVPPVTPSVAVYPPKQSPFAKAFLELLRLAVFAVPGVLINVLTNDPGVAFGYGVPILAFLKVVDAYIAANPNINLNGLLPL